LFLAKQTLIEEKRENAGDVATLELIKAYSNPSAFTDTTDLGILL
jgi:hypothetical protein